MAKAKAKKASIHSRAARRATSPSINTDKSLKNAKPPLIPGANILHNAGYTNSGAKTGAGVSKRGRKQTKTREQRLRLEKAMLRAETVMDQMGKKVEGSRRKTHVVKERSGAWEEVNGRIKDRTRTTRKLPATEEFENDEWEDAGDSEEEQVIERVGKMQVDDPRSPPVVEKVEKDVDDDDVIL